ncbi:hypothetical protein HWV62_36907 [Athelia sp. TMB]|nr:hypothetical protein HWV62_36907 [Athelia sp. TMB]
MRPSLATALVAFAAIVAAAPVSGYPLKRAELKVGPAEDVDDFNLFYNPRKDVKRVELIVDVDNSNERVEPVEDVDDHTLE